jgi:hypothetical protein
MSACVPIPTRQRALLRLHPRRRPLTETRFLRAMPRLHQESVEAATACLVQDRHSPHQHVQEMVLEYRYPSHRHPPQPTMEVCMLHAPALFPIRHHPSHLRLGSVAQVPTMMSFPMHGIRASDRSRQIVTARAW